MKHTFLLLLILISIGAIGCKTAPQGNIAVNSVAKTPEDGYYKGKGIVTRINNDLGSVEMDHEEIPDLMPAMKMEFTVKDKKMLKDLKEGDAVIFVVEYKQGAEAIASIEKAK